MTEQSLDEWLDALDEVDEQYKSEHERFTINDDSAAAWAMRRLRALRQRQATNTGLAEAETSRIAAWLESVNRPLDDRARYFEDILTDYAQRCRAVEDRKTISLPAGKITTRLGSPKWNVDPETFVPWALEHAPDLVRVTTAPALAVIKDTLGESVKQHGKPVTDDGEVVPGVDVDTDVPVSVTIAVEL